MIERTQEIERRLGGMEDELAALRAHLAAVRHMALQMAGAMPPIFGASSILAVARASGSIAPRSGTTLGTGTVNFATDAATLTEGTESTPVKNFTLFTIADNAWVLIGRTAKFWVVLLPFDCDDLS